MFSLQASVNVFTSGTLFTLCDIFLQSGHSGPGMAVGSKGHLISEEILHLGDITQWGDPDFNGQFQCLKPIPMF